MMPAPQLPQLQQLQQLPIDNPLGPAWALQLLLRQRAETPFVWGKSDCAIFAFDVVQLLTGRDVVADLRGTYSTAYGAMRVLVDQGGLIGLADKRLGARCAHGGTDGPPPLGRIALLTDQVCDQDGFPTGALGVVVGRRILAQGANGLVAVPLGAALLVWGLPDRAAACDVNPIAQPGATPQIPKGQHV